MHRYTTDSFFQERDFRFHIGRAVLDRRFPEHSHEFAELFVIVAGSAVHSVSDGQFPIGAGDVFVIHRPESHSFRNTDKLEIVNIMFDPETLLLPSPYLDRIPGYHALFSLEPKFRSEHGFAARLRLGGKAMESVRMRLAALESAYSRRAVGFEAELLAGFVDLVVFLAREYEENPSPSAADLLRVAGAMGLMEREYSRTIPLSELAETAGLSRNHFIRVFRRATGTSPIEYLNSLRAGKAAELLRGTRMTVTAIALETGFSDGNYLSRVFRRIYSMSPTTYRRGF